MRKIGRIGEINNNSHDNLMTIVEYIGANEITVKFINGDIIKTTYSQFKKGVVSWKYDKSIYGVGYVGEGIFEIWSNGKTTKIYQVWRNMIQRCYDKKNHKRIPTYKGCLVCEEWHNFQNFAKWYDENFYQMGNANMELDKDILVKGNKIYSPETCVFVPRYINTLFINCNSVRGKLPIGVCFLKKSKKFIAKYREMGGIQINLGCFTSPEEAFQVYKQSKEAYIKEVAEKYKDQIPQKLYQAMISYIIDIGD